jgi:SAM-dependent methyltransferase
MIPDWPQALQRAYAHLRPGGRLVVLDFGRFQGWGKPGALLRGWLRLNHVETLAPYEPQLRQLARDVNIEYWLGGYNFIAVARRSP